jgi:hypothetical protein
MNIKTIAQPSYSPVMLPLDRFLFLRVKAELMVTSMMQETFKKT